MKLRRKHRVNYNNQNKSPLHSKKVYHITPSTLVIIVTVSDDSAKIDNNPTRSCFLSKCVCNYAYLCRYTKQFCGSPRTTSSLSSAVCYHCKFLSTSQIISIKPRRFIIYCLHMQICSQIRNFSIGKFAHVSEPLLQQCINY